MLFYFALLLRTNVSHGIQVFVKPKFLIMFIVSSKTTIALCYLIYVMLEWQL